MAGEQTTYFIVERGDGYYKARGEWTTKNYDAAFMTEELAQRIAKRYPGSVVETNTGYDIHYKMSLADVGEPEATVALSSAVKLAARDGMSLQTVLVQVEKAFHEKWER